MWFWYAKVRVTALENRKISEKLIGSKVEGSAIINGYSMYLFIRIKKDQLLTTQDFFIKCIKNRIIGKKSKSTKNVTFYSKNKYRRWKPDLKSDICTNAFSNKLYIL